MMLRALLLWLLFLPLCAPSFADDPFALLFGEAEIDTSRSDRAAEDDLLVLQLLVRDYLVDDGWVAYETIDGLCLPLKAFTTALELPVSYDGDRVKGWILAPNQPIDLDLSAQVGFAQTAIGWCGTIVSLEKLFPVRLDYRASTLSLIIEPTTLLPLEAKLKREEARKFLELAIDSAELRYREVENPYQWFSWPTIDVNIDTISAQGNEPKINAQLDLSADVLKSSAHLRTVSKAAEFMDTIRFTLFRENYAAEELGLLNARRFAIGDISSPSLPLAARSASGRGLTISNRPLFKPDLFDRTVIRGVLPNNWEAELYDGETLLAFVNVPDINGQYVFDDVPLRLGYNNLTVKLFGPYGQQETRTVAQYVGAELTPIGEWRYEMGMIDPSTSISGDSLLDTGDEESSIPNPMEFTGQDYIFASLDYGLSQKYSLRADFRGGKSGQLSTISFVSSNFGGYGVLRAAFSSDGKLGFQAQYQKPLSSKTNLSIDFIDYGDLETQLNGSGSGRVEQRFKGRLDTRAVWRGFYLPVQSELEWTKKESGEHTFVAATRAAMSTRWVKMSNTLRYIRIGDASPRLQGEFLASPSVGGLRIRSVIGYSYTDAWSFDTVTLSAQKRINRNTRIQADVSYDMGDGKTVFDGSMSRSIGSVELTSQVGIDSQAKWKFGIGIAMSLFKTQGQNRYKTARPELTRTGVIAPRVFDDANNNGHFDKDDSALSNAQFIVGGSLRSESGDSEGYTLIDGLVTAKPTNAEVKLSSISDPFLRPSETGRTVSVRPGQVLAYDVPLTMRGDAEGILSLRREGLQTSISGVTIEAVTVDNRVISTTRTEYDGYFYFDDLPATELTIRVALDQMTGLNGKSKPAIVKLSRDNPSKLGLELFIDMLPAEII